MVNKIIIVSKQIKFNSKRWMLQVKVDCKHISTMFRYKQTKNKCKNNQNSHFTMGSNHMIDQSKTMGLLLKLKFVKIKTSKTKNQLFSNLEFYCSNLILKILNLYCFCFV